MQKRLLLMLIAFLFIMTVLPAGYPEFNLKESDRIQNHQREFLDTQINPALYSMQFTSTLQSTPEPVENGSVVIGELLVFNGTFNNAAPFDEDIVVSTAIEIRSGLYSNKNGTLRVPNPSYNPFSGPLNLSQFSWNIVDGIRVSTVVNLTVAFTNHDCDVFVFWANSDNSTWSYGNNIVSDSMATGSSPENTQFFADRDGSLAIGIFDYSLDEGNYTVTIDSLDSKIEVSAGNTITFRADSRNRNVSVDVFLMGTTENDVTYRISFLDILLCSNFYPLISNLRIESRDYNHAISWDISDLNQNDTHTFDILLSADDGDTYQAIALGLENAHYVWNSRGFSDRMFLIKVKVTDNWGLSNEIESEPFRSRTEYPDPIFVQISHPMNQALNFSTTGEYLLWDIFSSYHWTYQIFRNNTEIESGSGDGRGYVRYNLDGLMTGIHRFEIIVSCSGVNYSDTVFVTVIPPTQNLLLFGFSIGITAGSVAIIVLGTYKIRIEMKKREVKTLS